MLREGQTRQVSTPTREGKRETPLPLETKPVRCSLIDSLIEFSVKINDVPVLKIQQFWGPFLFAKALSTREQIGRKSVSLECSRKNPKTVEFPK